ncbi:glutamate 5-kinase [Natranaerovirga pectinivora]|uniref:Glutamate 5-kinase n=1 Tax=Natranaerovirga pectinivora TaxID=682400 RepID=A0A4R3MS71_9FIRM|nr:glutamate 5-kinase [Natranaerovirga pectinivora]TCT17068.1 glutamate 5-kinase [Natranaerovirga pectinivora]
MSKRSHLKDKKRIVIKIGSSSLTHPETGHLNLAKLDKFTRILSDLKNKNKDVILVTSGAIAVGYKAVGLKEKPVEISKKQACASVGQAILMMIYQKLFREYNQTASQILLTKDIMDSDIRRRNAENTFKELFEMNVIPIVNENDTISTEEIEFGDNDTLSAIVATLVKADLLILLSDIEGLYTDDPRKNKDAVFVEEVAVIDENLLNMAKGAGSKVGTGGMITKILAAKIATESGVDMVISNGDDVNNILRIIDGENIGTLFCKN